MRPALVILCSLFFAGCGTREAPPVTGPVATPVASQGVSISTESLIASKANAEISGDTKTVKAVSHAIADQNVAETDGGLRWLVLAGVVILAAGAGIAYYLGPKLGGGVIVVGGGLVLGAMVVSALQPYRGLITWISILGALGALAWHLRGYFHATQAVALNTEHLASDRVKGLIAKIRARGPSLLMKMKSLLHHHAAAAIPPVPPKA